MTQMSAIPGNAVVGRLTEVAPWEADLIMSMRLWMENADGQRDVWNSYARCYGSAEGHAKMQQFETLLTCLCSHARRPLVRHGLGCDCIGSDEAVLQTLVREAARGDLAEASMIASLLVPASHAEMVAIYAAQVGQAMKEISRHYKAAKTITPATDDRVLH